MCLRADGGFVTRAEHDTTTIAVKKSTVASKTSLKLMAQSPRSISFTFIMEI